MGSGCLTCCRWCCCCFLSVVNVLTTILGLAFLALGSVMLSANWLLRSALDSHLKSLEFNSDKVQTSLDVESIHTALKSLTMTSAAVLIVIGVVLVIISCLGCCGACCAVPSCLIIYAVFVGLILLSQAAIVIVWFTNSSGVNTCSRNWLESRVTTYSGVYNQDVASIQLDFVQLALNCCGVDNGNDFYTMSTKWNRTIGFRNNKNDSFAYYNATGYPYSCCNRKAPGQDFKCAYTNVSQEFSNYKSGCHPEMIKLFDNHLKSAFDLFFYSVAGCLGMEILLLLGALLIYYHKRQEQEDIPHSGVQYKMQPQMA